MATGDDIDTQYQAALTQYQAVVAAYVSAQTGGHWYSLALPWNVPSWFAANGIVGGLNDQRDSIQAAYDAAGASGDDQGRQTAVSDMVALSNGAQAALNNQTVTTQTTDPDTGAVTESTDSGDNNDVNVDAASNLEDSGAAVQAAAQAAAGAASAAAVAAAAELKTALKWLTALVVGAVVVVGVAEREL